MEYLITNGKIYTMDGGMPEAGAIQVKDGKITEVFAASPIHHSKITIPNSGVVDLKGMTLLPGFIDSHVHLLHTGLFYTDVNLEGSENLEEVFDRLREGISKVPDSGIIRAGQLTPETLKEKRYPTRVELDRISDEIPIYVKRRDGHSSVVNTKGLDFLQLPDEIEGTDKEKGILKRQANEWAWRFFLEGLSREEKIHAFEKACEAAIRKGITTLNALDGNEDPKRDDIEIILDIQDKIACDLVTFFQTTDVERVEKLGLRRIGGCVSLDGSIGSHSAALFEPYLDDPQNQGSLYFEDEVLFQFVEKSIEKGLQVTVHALGDRAVDQIVRAYENVRGTFMSVEGRETKMTGLRCRIEHAEVISGDLIQRIAESGISLSMQPAFEEYWGGPGKMYEERLGCERAEEMNPFRKILDHGIRICGGSDSPITPLNPLLGIHSAVNHPTPGSRVERKEAVEMFTTSGSWACFRENGIGKIAKGYQADFVVLSEDLFSVSSGKIKEIDVLNVIRKGEVISHNGKKAEL
jgi:predicted amidohydrolase YtcJ